MTLKKLIGKHIDKVRMSVWNETAYIQLQFTSNGYCAPWGILNDCGTKTDVLIIELIIEGSNEWESYEKQN